jgi:hypothetical protein
MLKCFTHIGGRAWRRSGAVARNGRSWTWAGPVVGSSRRSTARVSRPRWPISIAAERCFVGNPRWPRARQRGFAEEPVRLLPVQLIEGLEPPRGDRPLTLVLSGGLRLEVVAGFDAATLARVVEVLQERTTA